MQAVVSILDCGMVADANEEAAKLKAAQEAAQKRAEDTKRAEEREKKLVEGEDSDDDDGDDMGMVIDLVRPHLCASCDHTCRCLHRVWR